MSNWAVPYDQLRERKAFSLFHQWVCTACWYHPKVDGPQVTQGWPRKKAVKENPPREILTIHLDVHFVWIERWPELLTETDLWAVPNGMVECSRIYKEQDWKTANEKSRKRYVEAFLSEWAQTMKITLSHMSASRACFVKKAFHHQVNKMTCPVQVKLPPGTPVLIQWVHEWRSHSVKRREYAVAQLLMLLLGT